MAIQQINRQRTPLDKAIELCLAQPSALFSARDSWYATYSVCREANMSNTRLDTLPASVRDNLCNLNTRLFKC